VLLESKTVGAYASTARHYFRHHRLTRATSPISPAGELHLTTQPPALRAGRRAFHATV